ncbi:MAG: hypothetical protein KGH64_02070 [Candidatus Micrarchaeota archaeon]|nr:hypothetical protein [Candidatus Micrarchaeota archaeon]MDE1834103.1 hypothetical protein [Candidatus Micrarchaeota archaeon]MDE1859345.1 hypothetical protein [Candidatus Micrarchaeota archaeon]
MKKTSKKNNELNFDYALLEKMSKQLSDHEKNVRQIAKKVAKISKTDLAEGIAETLGSVSKHMVRAQREIDKAKSRLKMI